MIEEHMQEATPIPGRAPTIIRYKTVAESSRQYHQTAYLGETAIGEVWRECRLVLISSLTQPRRMGKKWRWFAKATGGKDVLGSNARVAMVLGAGFKSKAIAVEALVGTKNLGSDRKC